MKTALLFAGQGAQTVGMGKELLEAFPIAGELYNRANEVLGIDLKKIILEGPISELTRSEFAQPAIFLHSWVCFEVLKELEKDFSFDATLGLSLGEFTALAVAGVFSFEDGLRLVRLRGQFMQEACEETEGGMAALILFDLEKTQAVCEECGVELANLNCPGQLVISGKSDSVIRACEIARERGAKRAIPLAVAGAFHSSLMASAAVKLEKELETVNISEPRVPVISNVTAKPHLFENVKETLVKQVTHSVYLEKSLKNLIAEGFTRFIELGPGNVLSGFLKRISKDVEVLSLKDFIKE